jgi:hypothetical protein
LAVLTNSKMPFMSSWICVLKMGHNGTCIQEVRE